MIIDFPQSLQTQDIKLKLTETASVAFIHSPFRLYLTVGLHIAELLITIITLLIVINLQGNRQIEYFRGDLLSRTEKSLQFFP